RSAEEASRRTEAQRPAEGDLARRCQGGRVPRAAPSQVWGARISGRSKSPRRSRNQKTEQWFVNLSSGKLLTPPVNRRMRRDGFGDASVGAGRLTGPSERCAKQRRTSKLRHSVALKSPTPKGKAKPTPITNSARPDTGAGAVSLTGDEETERYGKAQS